MRRASIVAGLVVWTAAQAAPVDTVAKLAGSARELLQSWAEAQRRGDHAAYSRLYHPAFSGSSGSGRTAVRLNRAQWLAERRKGLGKPLQVSRVYLQATANDVRVHFTEAREAGGRRELTRKVLWLVRGGAALRIRGEGTLATLAAEGERRRQLALVLGQRVVLSSEVEGAWASGPERAEKAPQEQSIRVTREVALARLPPELRAWVGRKVRLLGPAGERCQATVSRLQLVGRVDGMEGEPPADQWQSASHLLTGVLGGDRKACAGATWARAASLPAPRVHAAQPADAKLRSAALAAFRALPEHRTQQAAFRRWQQPDKQKKRLPQVASWDEADGKPEVVVIRTPARTLIAATGKAWVGDDGGCRNTFQAALWALWEVEGEGATDAPPRLLLRSRPCPGISLVPTAATDLDGDGALELLFRSARDLSQPNAAGQSLQLDVGVVHERSGFFDDVEGLEVPVLVCPC